MQKPEDQVDAIFDYVDQLGINPGKRKKWENIALKYTYSSDINMLLDGDRQKISQVYALSQKHKFDPMAFKSPDEVIAVYSKKLTSKQVDASKYDMLTNREELAEGIETYNLDGSRKGQKQFRDIIDKCWGKAYQSWCITRSIKTKVEADAEAAAMADMGFDMMEGFDTEIKVTEEVSPLEKSYQDAYLNYNDDGTGKAVFKDKVLLGFIDKKGQFWNKMNESSNNIRISEKQGNKRVVFDIVGNKKTVFETSEGERGGNNTFKLFDKNNKLEIEERYKNDELVYKMTDDFLGKTLFERKETPTTITTTEERLERLFGEAPGPYTFRSQAVFNKKTRVNIRTTENEMSKTVEKSTNNMLDKSVTEYKTKDKIYAGPNQPSLYRFGKTDNHMKKLTTTMETEGRKVVIETVKDKIEIQYDGFNKLVEEKINGEVISDLRFSEKAKTETKVDPKLEQINRDFNNIIEQNKGVPASQIVSEARATIEGKRKDRFKFFIPPSAEDFLGLIYPLLGKGKVGEGQLKFFERTLLKPYSEGKKAFTQYRLDTLKSVEGAMDTLKDQGIPKALKNKRKDGFTNEQAVRVYLYDKAGYAIPGISETEVETLVEDIKSDPALKAFADKVFSIGQDYPKPAPSWFSGTIVQDYVNVLQDKERMKFLEESGFIGNVDTIFSESNKNKLRSIYGNSYVQALENIIGRMKSGTNRSISNDSLGNKALDYINGSVGAIMFLNMRSALLQLISFTNFINWSFNNPYKFAKAVGNLSQYISDISMIFNSDYLKDRRKGLKININEAELAKAAAEDGNVSRALFNQLIKFGFKPTQVADSIAIAVGGASFYRNRINDLVKREGMDIKQAEEQAFLEMQQKAEESQQSSDPSKISAQQASTVLGRLVLAFANTPMQYARLTKRAFQDLVNGRGDAKTNVSKIMYYTFVQNIFFNALQQAVDLFDFFEDDDDDYLKKNNNKTVLLSTLDGFLRGLGIAGSVASITRQLAANLYDRSKRQRPEYIDEALTVTKLSPPIGSKISKIKSALYQYERGKYLETSALGVEAITNLPTARLMSKVENLNEAVRGDYDVIDRIMMTFGWPQWQVAPGKSDKGRPGRRRGGSVVPSRRRRLRR